MLIRAGFTIAFQAVQPVPMLANLSVHASRNRDLRTAQRIMSTPDVPVYDYVDRFGNVCTRLTMPAGGITINCGFVIEDPFEPDRVEPNAGQSPIEELPDDVLVFLLASRYCETDRLSDTAWSLFGAVAPGWARVQAILDYAHNRIRFDYATAHPGKSAWDAHQQREGVCRDFAHLAITLCRCMNIPARYCTGYMGDMDLPAIVGDMDFSAWFEAYLDGEWYTFDARHNRPRKGRILMARGRDATDVALTTTFGLATLTRFEVYTDEDRLGLLT
ncbi:transglutaminase family protein (plasmid) [Polymorphobacter sp. PAMC 29334]|uniref:transglutaminase-like domain-containing protein n=1 Tax=Polymorphobacter sp. PAMC 29334 TaxID=2862331 RepID=UPI001C73F1E4|nr:transglutaminase family protein [Polymorphobacter sp. PAMC 29334]QYE33553.1 transglutaminase family protein [Polymorphobacter sp. PAMC 29334]